MNKTALYIGGGLLAFTLILGGQTAALIYFMRPATAVVPGPTPQQPLAALVTDAEHRATLSAFYRDFAATLAADSTTNIVKTTGQCRTAINNASKLLSQGKISYPAFAQAVSQRMDSQVSLTDAPLDATKRAALVACLTQISQELGG